VSDTPRTDAKAQFFGFNPDEGEEFVQADFARELERENAALRAVAMKLIENKGGSVLQLEEQAECDSVDNYILIKLQDFEALRAAIGAARKEQP
jgi:hypothetical protein